MDAETRKELTERVETALETIRPALQNDGGDVELIEIDDDCIAKVAMTGHCVGCPMAEMTLQMGIERTVKEQVPEIRGVEAAPPQAPVF